MTRLPQPAGALQRRIARPGLVISLLGGLAALPLLASAGILEKQARTSVLHVVASFAVLVLAFRVIGKRELGRLSPFELVTLMLIPEILSNAVQGQAAMLTALAGLSTVLLLVVFTSVLAQRFEGVQKVLEPEPTLLVAAGKLLENNMNRERISAEELASEMRKQGLTQLADVRWAVLEASGNITFVTKQPLRAQTESDNTAG